MIQIARLPIFNTDARIIHKTPVLGVGDGIALHYMYVTQWNPLFIHHPPF